MQYYYYILWSNKWLQDSQVECRRKDRREPSEVRGTIAPLPDFGLIKSVFVKNILSHCSDQCTDCPPRFSDPLAPLRRIGTIHKRHFLNLLECIKNTKTFDKPWRTWFSPVWIFPLLFWFVYPSYSKNTLLESVLCWVFFDKNWETQILVFY